MSPHTKHRRSNATQPGSEGAPLARPRSPISFPLHPLSHAHLQGGAAIMLLVTWNDAFTELWNQAARSRGTVTRACEFSSAMRYSSLPEWPRTTGADVIAIASLVDPILNETPLRPGGYGITRLWQTAVIEIEAIAFANPTSEY